MDMNELKWYLGVRKNIMVTLTKKIAKDTARNDMERHTCTCTHTHLKDKSDSFTEERKMKRS